MSVVDAAPTPDAAFDREWPWAPAGHSTRAPRRIRASELWRECWSHRIAAAIGGDAFRAATMDIRGPGTMTAAQRLGLLLP